MRLHIVSLGLSHRRREWRNVTNHLCAIAKLVSRGAVSLITASPLLQPHGSMHDHALR